MPFDYLLNDMSRLQQSMKIFETNLQTTNGMLQQMFVTLGKMESRMCTKADLMEILQEADARIIAHR